MYCEQRQGCEYETGIPSLGNTFPFVHLHGDRRTIAEEALATDSPHNDVDTTTEINTSG